MVEETLEHVLRCSAPQTEEFCTIQLEALKLGLSNIQTPLKVTDAIMNGFHDWLSPSLHRSKAPTYGSLFGPNILLTSAY
jgi:hypothetical protein